MSRRGRHPFTNRPNDRYITVVFEMKEGSQEGCRKEIVDALTFNESPGFAPSFVVSAIGIGDSISELEKIEEES